MKNGPKSRVILVEDEPDWVNEISKRLREAGYQVFSCQSYEEAVEHLAHYKFDLGVLDLSLKGEHSDLFGLWLLEDMIIAHQIPVMVVSGYVYPGMMRLAIRDLGVFAVLDKSDFSMSVLIETMARARNMAQQRQYSATELEVEDWQQRLRELYTRMTRRQLGGGELIEAMRGTLIQHRRRLTELLKKEEQSGMPLPAIEQHDMNSLQARVAELENELLHMELPRSGSLVEISASALTSQRDLRLRLVEHFDDEELRSLCLDLGLDYDSLRGEVKNNKVRELILWSVQRERLDELVIAVKQAETAYSKRCLLLAAAIVSIPPAALLCIVGLRFPPDGLWGWSFWISGTIAGWTAFLAAVAQFTGYDLRSVCRRL